MNMQSTLPKLFFEKRRMRPPEPGSKDPNVGQVLLLAHFLVHFPEFSSTFLVRCRNRPGSFDFRVLASARRLTLHCVAGDGRSPQRTHIPQLRSLTLSSTSSPTGGSEPVESLAFLESRSELCVHQLFDQAVIRTPDDVAVVCGNQSLTYAELDRQANQLAGVLRAKEIGPDVLVGVCLERSLNMVVALLGVLKAGGAYVPLDPTYPRDRIQYILQDAQAKVLVIEKSLRETFSDVTSDVVLIDSEQSLASATISSPLVTPSNLAYVIYTSGSTGRPKGVQIEHRNLSNLLSSIQHEPGFGRRDVIVAVTTISFDIAQADMFLPLISGARLVIADRETTLDGRRLAALLRDAGATIMQATPATWRLLIETGWNGQRGIRIFSTGEALPPELARELTKRGDEVWNLYGPTETTIWSTVYRVGGDEEKSVPIGRPIANTTLHLLAEDRKPVSPGKEGELYIAGAGVARGYLKRPELTGEKFLPDENNPGPNARMYRTGDLARFRSDGNLEYLGRIDHQVKLRGFRIELGEIEAVLEQHKAIKQAVVLAREDRPGNKYLAAYLTFASSDKPTQPVLREHLSRTLPDYMIPAAFVELQSFPMTPNGKVDRKALPAPTSSDFVDSKQYVTPRNPIERKLVAMWEEVLGITPIGVRTSFFDLGGRSVLAARLFMKISRVFGQDIPLATLFDSPTIEQLAKRLQNGSTDLNCRTLVEINPSGSRPPFFCVHGGTGGTLFLHRLARAMGTDQPFYAFQPQGVDGGRITRTSVPSIAAHYIAEMRKVQPQGPYFIGGYCFGGNVAFEMAQQLQQQGSETGVVAMFSAQLRFNRPIGERAFAPERLPYPINTPRQKSFSGRIAGALRWRAQKLFYGNRTILHKNGCRILNRLGIPVPQKWRELYIVRSLTAAEKTYVPQFFDGKLVIFRGGGIYDHDPGMGWSKLATGIEECVIGTVAGQKTRRDILNEPLVEQVAAQLKKLIDENLTRVGGPRSAAAAMPLRKIPEMTRPQDAA
jgi:amino acid adenylation domain-containing protein